MNDPQPIDTAPRDGTVILTDCGCAFFSDGIHYRGKWVECSPCGNPDECADNGWFICQPKLWVPLPEWMK